MPSKMDGNGWQTICSQKISPEGHRPMAMCNVLIFYLERRPSYWKSNRATRDDLTLEHFCREWTSEEDARLNRLSEEIRRERYSMERQREASALPAGRAFLEPFDEARAPKRRPQARESFTTPKVIRTPRPKPVLTAENTVTRGERVADAMVRSSRKDHPCAGKCTGGVAAGSRYVESREDGGTAFLPLRFCLDCARAAGYGVAER